MAHASRETLVTVEAIVDGDLLARSRPRGGHDSGGVRHARSRLRRGAPRRSGFPATTTPTPQRSARYAQAAKTAEGFRAWLDEWLAAEAAAA